MVADVERGTILRSVVMKPEQEQTVAGSHRRLALLTQGLC